MNEELVERFGRSTRGSRTAREEVHVWIQPQKLNVKVREYFDQAKNVPPSASHWRHRPEIPASSEILDTDGSTGSTASSGIVEIVPNKPIGAWESKEAYLSAQYELLREDAVRPLREAVVRVCADPTAAEDAFGGTVGIYEKVHICGIIASTRGIATRVTFSLQRVGKKVLWEQSKRLISGSLVALTPASDMFKTKAVIATVAARLLAGLLQNPPEIDLFIARAEEQELDPAMEWVMVEERGGFFEADRHTLLALQRMMIEPFPLSEHLVDVQSAVGPPQYVVDMPRRDLTSVLRNKTLETYENVDILRSWPAQPASNLDASQLAALHRILTKRLAIVQGPPGTGKTFVSVQAIKIMLANRKPDDPPIIVACQTNHAVDQILRHIAQFEPDFIRLGGRSKDKEIIKPRTLYEIRKQTSEPPLAGSVGGSARKKMRLLEKELALKLLPLKPEKTPIAPVLLEKLGLLTEAQAQSLKAGASQWVQDTLTNPNDARNPFNVWLGSALIPVPPKQLPEDFGFDFEEADLEFEQLKELEAENVAKDDEEFESLSGPVFPIADSFTCRRIPGSNASKVKDALKEQDMWNIPEALRGAVYRYLQIEMKSVILADFRNTAKAFNDLAEQRRIGRWESDECILKKQKVIGMTTTGLSKYRGLLAALEPTIVLIEEAAETLEAPVAVACMPSVQHVIFVGDHQQLRPHTHVKDHEDAPYYLNISLFERLVRNQVEFEILAKQRRMIPEIRRILYPIYGDLILDHPSVLDPVRRPPVPGMGGVNSFFFTHQWPEQRDDHMSAVNPDEAEMIVGFVEYLVYNGMKTEDITLLTFYNGQRKRLLSCLRETASLVGQRFNVVTVDSYQGEENKVVILSLVRSNDKGQVGFLNIDNRVCVALSRAQCGFYIFGNGMLLWQCKCNRDPCKCGNTWRYKTWHKIIDIMAGEARKKERPKIEPIRRIAEELPVRCVNHGNVVEIKEPADWEKITGGCEVKCSDSLACGHPCELKCHPFPHELISCQQRCGKTLPCRHGSCEMDCGEVCSCKLCSKDRVLPAADKGATPLAAKSSSESWSSYSKEESARYAIAASAPPPFRTQSKEIGHNGQQQLLNLSVTEQDTENKAHGPCYAAENIAPENHAHQELVVRGNGSKLVPKQKSKPAPGDEKAKGNCGKDWSKEGSLLD